MDSMKEMKTNFPCFSSVSLEDKPDYDENEDHENEEDEDEDDDDNEDGLEERFFGKYTNMVKDSY
ncbi:hypothetical protein P148_SR1C00001G0845 [candidate division SR1 bacterium RAAC1_SR1_1]|nr:hypothetical protein P148_SR1C00001G0845 [candidate division SR1 bacterium RAAC1_SR1_1]